jgi:hypothetical protein
MRGTSEYQHLSPNCLMKFGLKGLQTLPKLLNFALLSFAVFVAESQILEFASHPTGLQASTC